MEKVNDMFKSVSEDGNPGQLDFKFMFSLIHCTVSA